ncbi:MAG TPA: hypothetical protein VF306_17865 [Pirellulales bacterium]
MIELDRFRYDLIHSVPAAGDTGSRLPCAATALPWAATLAGALLAGFGLTRSRGFARLGCLAASAGLTFYAWSQIRRTAEPGCRMPESGDEHPLDIAGHGSFPASDPPSLTPRT